MQMGINSKDIIIPEKGNDDNLFQRLSDYIEVFNRSWNKRIKLASDNLIEKLIKVSEIDRCKRIIPHNYILFLKKMGLDDGGLLSNALLGTASIDDIIELYEDYHEFTPEVFDTSIFPFFYQETGGELSFDLNAKNSNNILVTDSGEVFDVISESFEKLLFQCAFSQFVRYKIYIRFGGSKNSLNKALCNNESTDILKLLDDISIKNNMIKIWFSDKKHYIAVGREISYYVYMDKGVSGFVTGNNSKLIKDICKELAYTIGVEINEK